MIVKRFAPAEPGRFTAVELAESAQKGYRHALDGLSYPDQPSEPVGVFAGIADLMLAQFMADEFLGIDGATFVGTAAACYDQWMDANNMTARFEELPRQKQLAFEAVVRHLVNLIDSEQSAPELDDLEAHERHWIEWARRKA